MLYDKKATTVEEQIDNLEKRGLDCGDHTRAARHMRAIGYYRLSAYWLSFEDPPSADQTRSKTFSRGASWDDVIKLYAFDRRLRVLVMEAIERVEVAVRSAWTNRLTLARGSHPHLNPDLFSDPFEHARSIARIASSIEKSEEVFVRHYRGKYTAPYMPPLWVVCETLTIGQLSQWFSSTLDMDVKQIAAKDVGLPTKEVLESVLQVVALTRNVCAHHGRLWNRRFVKRFSLIKKLRSELVVTEPTPGQPQMDNRIYNTLVVLIFVLRHQGDVTEWHDELVRLLETITDAQRGEMGFPRDWRARKTWLPA